MPPHPRSIRRCGAHSACGVLRAAHGIRSRGHATQPHQYRLHRGPRRLRSQRNIKFSKIHRKQKFRFFRSAHTGEGALSRDPDISIAFGAMDGNSLLSLCCQSDISGVNPYGETDSIDVLGGGAGTAISWRLYPSVLQFFFMSSVPRGRKPSNIVRIQASLTEICGQDHVDKQQNRVDGYDLEPGSWLHKDQPWMQTLLCGNVCRKISWCQKPPLREGIRLAAYSRQIA